MSNPSKNIIYQVPLHYQQYAPNFIKFMERYYEWLHRKSGMSYEETQELRAVLGDYETIRRNEVFGSGAESDLIQDFTLMEEVYDEFLTADGDYLVGWDDVELQAPKRDDKSIDSWFTLFGTTRPRDEVDPVLMITLMKHVNAIKGTQKSMELFFSIFFDEEVEVYYPKFDIAIIDDNLIPDVSGVIRDDYYYSEYSYVIRVKRDVSNYEELFQKVYMKNIHPAGFKVFLEKK